MEMRNELRNNRMEILKRIDTASSAIDFYNIQRDIILDIINSEKEYFNTSSEAHREHVLLLRNYGDTLPWLIFNEKSISEIYNKEIPLQFLSNNVEKMMGILDEGKKYAMKGQLVILGASTNLFFGRDIVLCNDEKEPLSIDFYNKDYSDKKIINFDTLKSNKINKKSNMRKDYSKFCSNKGVHKKIDTSWQKINDSIKKAILEDEGYCTIEKGNFVWAFKYNGDMPDMNEEVSSILEKYNNPMIGCHFTILDEPELMIPPPSCWPIELHNRMALMEGDIALMHYIDIDELKNLEKASGCIKDILYKGNKLEENCIVVSTEHCEKIYSSKYINDILYGYCKIDDIANHLIESVSSN